MEGGPPGGRWEDSVAKINHKGREYFLTNVVENNGGNRTALFAGKKCFDCAPL